MIAVTEVAEALNVNPDHLAVWARKNRRPNSREIFKSQGRNYMTLELADRYAKLGGVERVASRPRGWLTLKALILELGCSRTYLEHRIYQPGVRLVRHRRSLYLHPEDAAVIIEEYRDQRPLLGWRLVSEVRDEAGVSKEGLNQWLRRNAIERRRYRNPKNGRPDYYIREADAERYLEGVATRKARHTAQLHTRPGLNNRQRVYRVLRRSAEPLAKTELAERCGLSWSTVRRELRILADAGVVSAVGRGTSHHPYRYQAKRGNA